MLFLLPLELKERTPTPMVPWVNYALIAANVFLYLMVLVFGGFWLWTVGPGTGPLSVLLYGFSHAGFWHLVFNMWALWVFGNAVNRRLGNGYYLLAYVGTILALGVFARVLLPAQFLGASGGVFAVMIICFMLLPTARLSVAYGAIFPLSVLICLFKKPKYPIQWAITGGEVTVPALWCLVLVPFMELWALYWSGWGWTALGHLLGMLCGLAVVLLLPTRVSMKRPIPTESF